MSLSTVALSFKSVSGFYPEKDSAGMFGVLPLEVMVMIMKQLSVKDLASLEGLSSHFKQVVEEGEGWKESAKALWRNMVKKLDMKIGQAKRNIEDMDKILLDLQDRQFLGSLEEFETKKQEYIGLKTRCQDNLTGLEDLKKRMEDAFASKMWKTVVRELY